MYGVGLEPIEPDKPTGFALKDDIAIISLDTKATFDGDMLAEFTWSARFFDTASRKGRSPRDQYRTLTSSSQAHGASRNLRKEISNCELHEGTLATIVRSKMSSSHPATMIARSLLSVSTGKATITHNIKHAHLGRKSSLSYPTGRSVLMT
jgi:hypothetical protein